MKRVLVARLDSIGDVLLVGPLVRAVAASGAEVVLLCSRRGEAAARLLPCVSQIEVFDAPWIDPEPTAVSADTMLRFVERVRSWAIDAALVATSSHQSPLPLALLLRMAGCTWIGAPSHDYPGSLLDVRHRPRSDVHEVERNLSLGRACGFELAPGDDARLSLELPRESEPAVRSRLPERYVVVHPGASVTARTWHPEGFIALVAALSARGQATVVTGGPAERQLTSLVAGPLDPLVTDLGGMADLAELARVIRPADVLVVGNTGPAHLAAALGTPVVSLFPPTVPAERWRPWLVDHILLGDQDIGCAGCRARTCPVAGHPCLDHVKPLEVLRAIDELATRTSSRLPTRVVTGGAA